MTEIARRLQLVEAGFAPEWKSQSHFWYATRPVRLGALGTGRAAFREWVWRNECMGVTIYQPVDLTSALAREFADFMANRPQPRLKRGLRWLWPK